MYARVFSLQSRKRIKIMSAQEIEYIKYDIREIEERARAMRSEALRDGVAWIAARLRNGLRAGLRSVLRSAKTTGALAAN